jgi:hypothetical protein
MTNTRNRLTPEKLEQIRKTKERNKEIEAQKELKSIGKWLFFPAILLTIPLFLNISAIIEWGVSINKFALFYYIITQAIPIIIFSILGFTAPKRPYPSLLIGLIFFLFTNLISVISYGPIILLEGIIWRILIAFSLIVGLQLALNHKKKKTTDSVIDDIDL